MPFSECKLQIGAGAATRNHLQIESSPTVIATSIVPATPAKNAEDTTG